MSKVTIKTPFCTICKNSGKSEGQYTSHNVKSKTGAVICPTILQNICSICNIKGHFNSRCPNKKKVVESILKPTKLQHKEKKVEPERKKITPIKNTFAILDDSDSEDECEEQNICEEQVVCVKVEVKCTSYDMTKSRKYTNWADVESSDEEDSDTESD